MNASRALAFTRLKTYSSRFGKMILSLAAVGFVDIVDGHLERDFSLSVSGKAASNAIALTTTADFVFLAEEEGFTSVGVPHVIFIAPKTFFRKQENLSFILPVKISKRFNQGKPLLYHNSPNSI